MPLVRTVAKIGFRHEGHYVQPGEELELPSVDARALVARGKVEEKTEGKQEKAERKRSKREYARRDMIAEQHTALTAEKADREGELRAASAAFGVGHVVDKDESE